MTRLDKKPTLRVGSEKMFIHLLLDPTHEMITGLISNPNRFKSWTDYVEFIQSILPLTSIQTAKVTRLDLNIDFNTPFNQLIQQINIKQKSTGTRYEDKKGERTGIYIGKGSEILVIYDKSKKDKLSSSHSRIELRLARKKLPTQSLYDLPQYLKSKSFFSHLEGVYVAPTPTLISDSQKKKIQEFQSILQRDGFFAARKAMDQNRNFDRDFVQVLKISPWPTHPSEIFKRGIQAFLEGNSDTTSDLH
ncbi:hypothetical protein [Bdellovibrio bacteriovorus]|uniref:Uncharacterized protein n=1 Tax=Bdellovibrio bacteriovorus TaxID=959 RepID=A0A1Z3N9V0_BDEBC|nr:hypothetical protein [Bdellovibrio bacteriovorus]ASD64250.1 hypothetical protein B9G79_12065 [Bdellovibrio bacteriovorus]